MQIKQASMRANLSPRTIRFYEQIGLVRPRRQSGNGYREYDEADVHRLRFVQRARSLGFTVEECRELMALYADRERASADVKAIALARIADIDRKIEELVSMRHALAELAEKCQGDSRPDCPILEELAGTS